MSDNYKSETAFDATHRFLFDNTDIRGNLTCLKNSYREILAHQNTPAALLPLLGEFLAAVSLLSETLKFEGTLTLQVRGDGPVPLVVAEATDKGDIRGIMKLRQGDIEAPSVALEQHSFRELLGRGALTITIDPAQGQRYQGIVPLEGETLAECISLYFQQSEQLPTYVWLFADDNDCGGLLLQSLPAQKITDPEQRKELWQTALQLAKTLRREEVSSLHHETLLFRLFHEMNCRVFPARSIQFKCSCTRARSESAIASLGKAEAYELLAEQGKIAIDCQFCGQHYAFKQQDLDKLFGSNGLQ